MDYKPLSWKQFICTPVSLHLNLQLYINNGKELLELDEVKENRYVKEDIEKKIKKAEKVLRGGKV